MTGEELAQPGAAPGGAAALAAALAAEGLHCDVEARGGLAVLRSSGAAPALADPHLRRRATALATAHGFTHVALDLSPPEDDAR
jgi:hypothetical protein